MPNITYIEHHGTHHHVDVAAGLSLMEGAVHNAVPGILAQCGGACACATCQVYVPEAWWALAGDRSQDEAAMLEFASDVRANSRLACQIRIVEAMDGMVVYLPAAQG